MVALEGDSGRVPRGKLKSGIALLAVSYLLGILEAERGNGERRRNEWRACCTRIMIILFSHGIAA
jgi:hypothetical protein